MIADAAFEPAKRELTAKQQRFVDAFTVYIDRS
jgi:hypothetical protein